MKAFFATLLLVGIILTSNIAKAAEAPAPQSVLILPFTSPENAGDYAWAGRGIQQSLVVDLTRDGGVKVLAPATATSAADVDAAIKAGRDAGASTVVFGAYQVVDKNIRVTGQVVEVATGKSIESLKGTGPVGDLFKIEDGLSGQLVSALGGGGVRWQPRDTYTATAQATVPARTVEVAEATYPRPQAYTQRYVYTDPYDTTDYYPSYSYATYSTPYYYHNYVYGPAYYSYPSYGYGYYPYSGLSLSFGYSSFGHRYDGFRGHDGFRGGFSSGIHIGGGVGYLGSLGRFGGGGSHSHGGRR